MTRRKEARQFFVCVEGECEQWYLDHLKKLINSSGEADFNAGFTYEYERNLLSLQKRRSRVQSEYFFYLWDKEGEFCQDDQMFYRIFANLRHLKKAWRRVQIEPGYSHLSFELWILLHRRDFHRPMTNVKQYLEYLNAAYETSFESLKQFKQEKNFCKLLTDIRLEDVFAAIRRADAIRQLHQQTQSPPHPANETSPHTVYQTNPDLLLHDCVRMMLEACGLEVRQ